MFSTSLVKIPPGPGPITYKGSKVATSQGSLISNFKLNNLVSLFSKNP